MFSKIVFAVNIINILFAPENVMVAFDELRTVRQKEVSLLTGKAMELHSNQKGILIHSIHLNDACKTERGEIILFSAEPVYIYTDKEKSEQAFPRQDSYEILNPVITLNSITGIDFNTGYDIKIILATRDQDLQAAKDFQAYLHGLVKPPANFNPYLTYSMHEMGESLQKFRYKHYQSIRIGSPV